MGNDSPLFGELEEAMAKKCGHFSPKLASDDLSARLVDVVETSFFVGDQDKRVVLEFSCAIAP